MRLDLFLVGFAEYAVSGDLAAEAFERLHEKGISQKGTKRYEKTGEIHFFCTLRESKKLQGDEALLTPVRRGGLPLLCRELWHRPGLLCGLMLAVALLVGARLFLWEIEVEGNEQIAADELLSELSAAGLSRGTFLPKLDEEGVALALRQGDGRIAYATVNLRGTVARVQIREAITPTKPAVLPAELVAARDGVVVLPLVFEGEVLVREGDVVRAGQVLAGGVIESEKHGTRMTRAAGQVWARTVHTYRVEVPFSYEETVLTGKRGYDVDLLFFGFRLKVFKNSGNLPKECDIIQNIKWCTLPNGRTLPIGVAITTSAAYRVQGATRTATEARELAMAELTASLAADSAGRTVLSRTVETVVGENGVKLICTLVCEEDIALTRELDVIPEIKPT